MSNDTNTPATSEVPGSKEPSKAAARLEAIQNLKKKVPELYSRMETLRGEDQTNTFLIRHRMGKALDDHLAKQSKQSSKYGKEVVKEFSLALDLRCNYLYQCRQIAKSFPDESDFEKFSKTRTANDMPITITHVMEWVRCKEKTREKLWEGCLTENLTPQQLSKRRKLLNPRTKSKPKDLKNFGAVYTRTRKMMQDAVRHSTAVLSHPEHSLLTLLNREELTQQQHQMLDELAQDAQQGILVFQRLDESLRTAKAKLSSPRSDEPGALKAPLANPIAENPPTDVPPNLLEKEADIPPTPPNNQDPPLGSIPPEPSPAASKAAAAEGEAKFDEGDVNQRTEDDLRPAKPESDRDTEPREAEKEASPAEGQEIAGEDDDADAADPVLVNVGAAGMNGGL